VGLPLRDIQTAWLYLESRALELPDDDPFFPAREPLLPEIPIAILD